MLLSRKIIRLNLYAWLLGCALLPHASATPVAAKPEAGSPVALPAATSNASAATSSANTTASGSTNPATTNPAKASLKPVVKVMPEVETDVELADQPSAPKAAVKPGSTTEKASGMYFNERADYQDLLAKATSNASQTSSEKPVKPARKTRPAAVSAPVQEVFFADNEQVTISLSSRDINRLMVKGDKIHSVNGPTGLYTAKNDNAGAAYISLFGDTHFTLFITTLGGHNASLLVTPKNSPGRTVILQPTTAVAAAGRFEEVGNYQASLIALMQAMTNQAPTEEYTYHPETKAKATDFHGLATLKPLASYHGTRLLGMVSTITNKTKEPLVLKPSYFYQPAVRAVSLSAQTIAPKGQGLVYQIFSRT